MKDIDGKCPICDHTVTMDNNTQRANDYIEISYNSSCYLCGYSYQIYADTYGEVVDSIEYAKHQLTLNGKTYTWQKPEPFNYEGYAEGSKWYKRETKTYKAVLEQVRQATKAAKRQHQNKMANLGNDWPLYVSIRTMLKADPDDVPTRNALIDLLHEHGMDAEAQSYEGLTAATETSKQWMHKLAIAHQVPYEDLLSAGHMWVDSRSDNYPNQYCQMGSDSLRDNLSKDDLASYWEHWQTITGEWSPKASGHPFSCSC